MEKKNKGIRLGRKLARVFKWCMPRRTRRTNAAYQRLEPSAGPISRICRWVQTVQWFRSGKKPGYIRLGGDAAAPPKGHMAVYVGEKEGNICRVVVPVLYFNHPLFASLLREAEKIYGFDHQGGIQIPCRKSDLETVQTKIAAAASGGGIWRRLMQHRGSFLSAGF